MKSTMEIEKENWFVIYTSSNGEKKVEERIQNSTSFEVFFPYIKTVRQWSDRKKKIDVPLISRTLFVKCFEKDLLLLYSIQGIVRVLKWMGKPAIVKDAEILCMKSHVQGYCESWRIENFVNGEEVEITYPGFTGMKGVVAEMNGKQRVKVFLDGMKINCIIEIPSFGLKKY
jgi:transcriptional antiterminator RfaH